MEKTSRAKLAKRYRKSESLLQMDGEPTNQQLACQVFVVVIALTVCEKTETPLILRL